uniref:Uncharacterized protein n=1 Tax=Anguilla anguilla TaxID=7936 RepID=A0A0E9SN69_ANGAN
MTVYHGEEAWEDSIHQANELESQRAAVSRVPPSRSLRTETA